MVTHARKPVFRHPSLTPLRVLLYNGTTLNRAVGRGRRAMAAIQTVRYTHDGMIDMMLAEPELSQRALAARFGYTESWISTIINSDAFQARLAARRAEIVDPTLQLTLEDKWRGLTVRSVEVLMRKLDRPVDAIPDNLVLKAAELGAKVLPPGKGGNQLDDGVGGLTALAANLIKLRGDVYTPQPPITIIEGESHEVPRAA